MLRNGRWFFCWPHWRDVGYSTDADPWRDCILRLRAHDDEKYRTRPTTTTCTGHRGFYHCTTF